MYSMKTWQVRVTTQYDRGSVPDTPFRFFDLPQQVRDKVLAHCTQSATLKFCDCFSRYWSFRMSSFYIANLRLVSRRFQQEYEQEAARTSEVTVYVHDEAETVGGFSKALSSLPASYFKGLRKIILRPLEPLPHQTIRGTLESLKVQYGYYTNQYVPEILALTGSEAEIELRMAVYAHPLEKAIKKRDAEHCGAPTDLSLRTMLNVTNTTNCNAGTPVTITRSLLVCGYLYEVAKTLKEQNPRSYDRLLYADSNLIIYRATPSNHEQAWWGLALEVVSSGVYDYKTAIGQADETWREECGRDGVEEWALHADEWYGRK
ncbi:hypothetical protein LTR56_013929 [Elasticomyces elasticus]|nr:hypothetical protein LTR56_013929 [Elasticomyces elasticus]KAK3659540.1 hypothetical protein LTR22_008457 [Elasticomyces elasticus]KAK4923268.1 hypothetical protein LTR49_009531 [Elasticomyces elasticus]KAK5757630.1 hypothetical protein LTS12_012232 [Elasticomyces elasticus]